MNAWMVVLSCHISEQVLEYTRTLVTGLLSLFTWQQRDPPQPELGAAGCAAVQPRVHLDYGAAEQT